MLLMLLVYRADFLYFLFAFCMEEILKIVSNFIGLNGDCMVPCIGLHCLCVRYKGYLMPGVASPVSDSDSHSADTSQQRQRRWKRKVSFRLVYLLICLFLFVRLFICFFLFFPFVFCLLGPLFVCLFVCLFLFFDTIQ